MAGRKVEPLGWKTACVSGAQEAWQCGLRAVEPGAIYLG